uniref:T-complex protein 1 subunit gamma n=1 Tax=Rhodosorus marinus TaxID=101924 RepID=A0A7S0G3W3_9RHOD|mmetsp:Transcript_16691/g.24065  ORF Transcript_16691/g.24065 Transcript_16691/m.24065 type:complete len:542 (+) Transcript_16691:137-1762(+)
MQAPVLVLNEQTQRDTGHRAQLTNIAAAKAVSEIIRTTLGPRAMLKMILDASGGIVLTNDGNAILREIDVNHPAAKSIIELSKTQDEEVGDGTTSVSVLAGELLSLSEQFLERNIHPTVVVNGFFRALNDAVAIAEELSMQIDVNKPGELDKVVASCVGTKYVSRYGDLMVKIAIEAVNMVKVEDGDRITADFKNYAKVEKIPGGDLKESKVLSGVMFNKDVVSGTMRRRIENPRIILLDTPVQYQKGESQTNIELTKGEDFQRLMELEEEYVQKICDDILKFNPDVVITEKGISDLALHFFSKKNVSCIRRLRKTDNNRVARACGATIVSRTDELKESDVGTGAGLFEVSKIGDEYFTYVVDCKDAKACSIVLRGGSKDVLNEVERNLQDAMCVARNVGIKPSLVCGGGAIEMAISRALMEKSKSIEGVVQQPYQAVAQALEVIPRTLVENCGASVVRVLTALRAKHANGENTTFGVDGMKGEVVDMRTLGLFEPLEVKTQTIKTSVEAAAMLLRIDDVVSGITRKQDPASGPVQHDDDD